MGRRMGGVVGWYESSVNKRAVYLIVRYVYFLFYLLYRSVWGNRVRGCLSVYSREGSTRKRTTSEASEGNKKVRFVSVVKRWIRFLMSLFFVRLFPFHLQKTSWDFINKCEKVLPAKLLSEKTTTCGSIIGRKFKYLSIT